MRSTTLRNTCIGALIGAALTAMPAMAQTINLKALGQPGGTGLIQK